MKKILKLLLQVIAIITGIFGGFVGGVHGYYEALHGSVTTNSLFYDAISGTPLSFSNLNWIGWPAMTIVPNFLATGIIAIIISIIVIVWTIFRVNKPNGGLLSITFFIVLCLFGGGFVPIVFGITSGIVGTVGSRIEIS